MVLLSSSCRCLTRGLPPHSCTELGKSDPIPEKKPARLWFGNALHHFWWFAVINLLLFLTLGPYSFLSFLSLFLEKCDLHSEEMSPKPLPLPIWSE